MSQTDNYQHQQPPYGGGYSAPPQKAGNGMGVAALVLGIIAIILAFIPFIGILSFILGIAAVVLGFIGMRKKDRARGTSIAGLVLGGLALVITAIVTAFTATVVGAVDEALQSSAPSASIEAPATTAAASPDVSEETEAAEAAEETEETETADTESSESAEAEVSREYQSALVQGQMYSDTMSMSKAGLWEQLTSEYGGQFSEEAADYAVENVDADWNQNALDKARDYQDTMNMSPAAIYDQLVSEYGEQFTADEAQYAVDNL